MPCKALCPNQVWTIDFQEDSLLGGCKVRLLNILDEFTRQWLAVVIVHNASAKLVMGTLLPLFAKRGVPLFLRSDNGGEFIAEDLKILLKGVGASSRFIEPGSPWQNGYIESFHSRLRDELLNRETFVSLVEARVLLEQHRLWYNAERPHSSLGYASPDEFHGIWQKNQVTSPPIFEGKSTEQKKN